MPFFKWNGHRLHYRERGEGPLLLVLPGNTASSACHPGELAYYCDRYHVVSLDFLGTGQSDRVAVWADGWWEGNAHQAAALVSHLGEADCVVMGTSGGGVVALHMAHLLPDLVRAVIADSCGERFRQGMLGILVKDRAQRTPGQIGFWKAAHGAGWEQVIEADTEMMRRFSAQGGDWFRGCLPSIRCPVLLTASWRDPFLPDAGRKLCNMAEQIDDCRVYLHSDGDHPLIWSRPDVFRAVSDFFLQAVRGLE